MAIDTGINVSKAVAYAATSSPVEAIDVSKLIAYALVTTQVTLHVSKLIAYAAVEFIHPGVNVSKAIAYAAITTGIPPAGTIASVWTENDVIVIQTLSNVALVRTS